MDLIAVDEEALLPSPVTVPTESSPQQQPTSTSNGNQVVMETTPIVAMETKKSIPEPPGRPQILKGEESGGRGRGGGGGGGGGGEGEKEKRTVFVSNLKMSVTKEDVEKKFLEVSTTT